jgi:hypothetical protein
MLINDAMCIPDVLLKSDTASAPGVCSVRRDVPVVTSAWRLLSESAAASSECYYNNTTLLGITTTGNTVQDVTFS